MANQMTLELCRIESSREREFKRERVQEREFKREREREREERREKREERDGGIVYRRERKIPMVVCVGESINGKGETCRKKAVEEKRREEKRNRIAHR
jgi:hypothetical protein